MKFKELSISKNRTILVDGVFDKNTKYMKIGVSLVGEFDDESLFDDQKQKLSDEVDKIMNEEIMKIKNKAKQQYDNPRAVL